jgi:hypothetical protein
LPLISIIPELSKENAAVTILDNLPVAVIGGGPVGLAAAVHLLARGLNVKLYEAGVTVAAGVRDWGHVRVFTSWEQNIDAEAKRLLERHGWRMPHNDGFPTGEELYQVYLKPLALSPELAAVVETNARVVAVSRHGLDKVASHHRQRHPFELRVVHSDGTVRRDLTGQCWTHRAPGRTKTRSGRMGYLLMARQSCGIDSSMAFPMSSSAIARRLSGGASS